MRSSPILTRRDVRRRLGWLPDGAEILLIRESHAFGWTNRWFAAFRLFDDGQFITIPVLTQTALTTPTGSNQTYTSDATWNNSNNSVECVGAGASGGTSRGSGTAVATGGGGGGYSKITNFTFASPGTTTATWQTGTHGAGVTNSTGNLSGNDGGDSWWNDTAFPTTGNGKAGAKGGVHGVAGAQPQNGGAGGAAASGYAVNSDGSAGTKQSGGRGGNLTALANASGGGGAGGPNGDGVNGTDRASSNGATAGGAGDAGSGGAGSAGVRSTTVAATSNPGSAGTELDGTHGCGGGSGGANTSIVGGTLPGTSGTGGAFGAGSGGAVASSSGAGSNGVSGNGGDGLIVLTWTPAAAVLFGWLKASSDIEHPFPINLNPDEARAWFQPSQIPVPQRWPLPTGEDVERLPPIKHPPDQPLAYAPRPPTVVGIPNRWPLPTGEDVERIFPLKLNPDEARQWFRPSQIPVPQRWPLPTGQDVERIFPLKLNPDEAKQYFSRPPDRVGIAWFRPPEDIIRFYPPTTDQRWSALWPPFPFPAVGISGIGWFRPPEDIIRQYPGNTNQLWQVTWTPIFIPPGPIVGSLVCANMFTVPVVLGGPFTQSVMAALPATQADLLAAGFVISPVTAADMDTALALLANPFAEQC